MLFTIQCIPNVSYYTSHLTYMTYLVSQKLSRCWYYGYSSIGDGEGHTDGAQDHFWLSPENRWGQEMPGLRTLSFHFTGEKIDSETEELEWWYSKSMLNFVSNHSLELNCHNQSSDHRDHKLSKRSRRQFKGCSLNPWHYMVPYILLEAIPKHWVGSSSWTLLSALHRFEWRR